MDDEVLVHRIFSQRFRKEILGGGLILHFAVDGDQALKVLSEHSISLVLTDINMPGMSGLELLKKIRRNHLETQVHMVSAYDGPDFEEMALALGADGFFSKPLDFEDVRNLIKRIQDKGYPAP